MKTLTQFISAVVAVLFDHERRIVALERPQGPPVVLRGTPIIKR